MPEEIAKAWPGHYRYIDTISPDGLEVHCISHQVIGETEQCYYIGEMDTAMELGAGDVTSSSTNLRCC